MKIAVISDIHENFHNLFLAFEDMRRNEVEQIFCLGDLMNPGIAKVLAAQDIPTHLIWGNNDGEKVIIVMAALAPSSKLSVAMGTYDFVERDGKKIFLTHYDDLADPMAKSGEYDAVFYGHDHQKTMRSVKGCPVVNPGELAAMKTGEATWALYDTKTNKIEIKTLQGSITLKSDYSDTEVSKYLSLFSKRSQKAFGNE